MTVQRRRATAKDEVATMRRCIVTRESKPTAALLRFVVSPDGVVVPDVMGVLPGRGIWVSADRASVETAAAKGLFARAARHQVKTDPRIADLVEAQLLRRCLDLIGLARRSGGAVAGFEKVRAFLAKESAGLLLAAADGADDGRGKMERIGYGVAVASALDRQELGQAFGREQVVHAVVASGKIAEQLEAASRRLSGFRQQSAE
ncbi:MAG: RNA-binding protein [Alphaproteobacteria bacterium]